MDERDSRDTAVMICSSLVHIRTRRNAKINMSFEWVKLMFAKDSVAQMSFSVLV